MCFKILSYFYSKKKVEIITSTIVVEDMDIEFLNDGKR